MSVSVCVCVWVCACVCVYLGRKRCVCIPSLEQGWSEVEGRHSVAWLEARDTLSGVTHREAGEGVKVVMEGLQEREVDAKAVCD